MIQNVRAHLAAVDHHLFRRWAVLCAFTAAEVNEFTPISSYCQHGSPSLIFFKKLCSDLSSSFVTCDVRWRQTEQTQTPQEASQIQSQIHSASNSSRKESSVFGVLLLTSWHHFQSRLTNPTCTMRESPLSHKSLNLNSFRLRDCKETRLDLLLPSLAEVVIKVVRF